jgi:hypothetical protein
VRGAEAQPREVTARDKILERRRIFVASALAGTVATQCNPCACLSPAPIDAGAGVDAGLAVPAAIDAGDEPDVLDEADAPDDASSDDAEAGTRDAATDAKAKRAVRKSSARPCLIAYVPDDDPFR